MKLLTKFNTILSKSAIVLLTIYRRFISPLFPNSCRFEPTCSVYSIAAFRKYGFFRGILLSSWRVVRCNPWSKGGNDPLP